MGAPTITDPGRLGPGPASSDEAELTSLAAKPVIPLLRPGRWLATAIVALLIAQFAYGLVSNRHYEWGRFQYWFAQDVILSGLKVTLEVTGWSALFGLIGGVLLAIARLSSSPLLRAVSWLYIWFFRSLPLIVLLLILYNFAYFYPRLSIGVPFGPRFVTGHTTNLFTPLIMGVLALSLNEAAYAAELVRGGLLSVDHGQIEAANALGLSRARQLRRVILPQALRSIVPGYVNQLVGLIKSSSLVYYVSLLDVFGQVFLLESRYPTDVVPLLLVGAAWYLILTAVLSVLQFYVERFFSRGAVRTLPPTPLQKLRSGSRDTWRSVQNARARLLEVSAR
jgi:polar amino acid transport system permease protein